jgi:hypothetical protein
VIPDRRRGFRVLVLSALLIFTFPPIARAEWQFTPFIGYTFKATSTFIDFDIDENRVATDQTRLNFGGAVRLIGESIHPGSSTPSGSSTSFFRSCSRAAPTR